MFFRTDGDCFDRYCDSGDLRKLVGGSDHRWIAIRGFIIFCNNSHSATAESGIGWRLGWLLGDCPSNSVSVYS